MNVMKCEIIWKSGIIFTVCISNTPVMFKCVVLLIDHVIIIRWILWCFVCSTTCFDHYLIVIMWIHLLFCFLSWYTATCIAYGMQRTSLQLDYNATGCYSIKFEICYSISQFQISPSTILCAVNICGTCTWGLKEVKFATSSSWRCSLELFCCVFLSSAH